MVLKEDDCEYWLRTNRLKSDAKKDELYFPKTEIFLYTTS